MVLKVVTIYRIDTALGRLPEMAIVVILVDIAIMSHICTRNSQIAERGASQERRLGLLTEGIERGGVINRCSSAELGGISHNVHLRSLVTIGIVGKHLHL